jgi:hypothetical protein
MRGGIARFLVASDALEPSEPVAAAVRAAGYLSEEEGDDGEERGRMRPSFCRWRVSRP